MLDIIIGAAIGFLSSLGILIVTNRFQQSREIRNRDWQLNDQERERLNQIASQRIEQLELFSKDIVVLLGRISLEMYANLSSGNREDKYKYLQMLQDEINPLTNKMPYYAAIASYIGGEVNVRMLELNKKLISTHTMVTEQMGIILKNQKFVLDNRKIFETANVFHIFPTLLQALDRLRYHPPDLLKIGETASKNTD